jgi:hypothetical protein
MLSEAGARLLVNMLPVSKAVEEIGTTALSGVTGRKLMCEIKLPARFHEEPPRAPSVCSNKESEQQEDSQKCTNATAAVTAL